MISGDATLKYWGQVFVAIFHFLRVHLFQLLVGAFLVAFTKVEQTVFQLIGGGLFGLGLFALADIAVPLLVPYALGFRIKLARIGDSGRYQVFERPYLSMVIFERGGSIITYSSRSRPYSVGGHLQILFLHRLTHLVVAACVLAFAFLRFGFGSSAFVATDNSIRWVTVVLGVGGVYLWHSLKIFFKRDELAVIWFSFVTERHIRKGIKFESFRELCLLAERQNWSGYSELFEKVVLPLQPKPSWPLIVNEESNLPGLYAIALVHNCQIDKLYDFINSSGGIYGSDTYSPEKFFLKIVFVQTAEKVKPNITNGDSQSFSHEALRYLDARKRALALIPNDDYGLEYLMSFEYVPSYRQQTIDQMLDFLNRPGLSFDKHQVREAAVRLLAAREAGSVVRDFDRALNLLQPYLDKEGLILPDGIRQNYIHYATFILSSLGEHRRAIDLVMREISSVSYTLPNVNLEYNLTHLLISIGDIERARYYYSRCVLILSDDHRAITEARLTVASGGVITDTESTAAILSGSQGPDSADSARLMHAVSLIRLGKLDEARKMFAGVVDTGSIRFEARNYADELQRIQVNLESFSGAAPNRSEFLDKIEGILGAIPVPSPAITSSEDSIKRRFSFLWVLVASGVLFLFSFADLGWMAAASLIPILLLHELGHIIAMRAFGAKDTRILFLPFLGAVALGDIHSVTLTPAQKIVIAMAGPVPGLILAGVLMLTLGRHTDSVTVSSTIFMLLVINGVNLFPIYPLDGGIVISRLLFDRFPIFAAVFIGLSFLVLAAVSADFGPIGGTLIVGVMLIETIYAIQTALTKRRLIHALRSENATKEDFNARAHRWIAEHAPRKMDTVVRARLCDEVAQILAAQPLGFKKRVVFGAAYGCSVVLFFTLFGLQMYLNRSKTRIPDPFIAHYTSEEMRTTKTSVPEVLSSQHEAAAVSELEREFVMAVSRGEMETAKQTLSKLTDALDGGSSNTLASFELALAILSRDYPQQERIWGEESE